MELAAGRTTHMRALADWLTPVSDHDETARSAPGRETSTPMPSRVDTGRSRFITYERKLLLGLILIAASFVPLLILALVSFHSVSRSQDKLDSVYVRTLALADELRVQKAQQNALLPIFVATADPDVLRKLNQADEAFDTSLNQLASMPLKGGSRELLADIGRMQDGLRGFERSGIALKRGGTRTDEVNDYFRRNTSADTRLILDKLDTFVSATRNAYRNRFLQNQTAFGHILATFAASALCTLAFCIVVGLLLVRLIRRKEEIDKMNERLAHREQEISIARKEAVETVAHDLRNPLSAAFLITDRLQAPPSELSQQAAASLMESLASALQSMQSLIENVLDHAKIESGSLVLETAPCDLRVLIARLVDRFEFQASRKGVVLDDAVALDLPLMNIDGARMEQVFSNLLANAIKFTPDGGTVRVRGIRRPQSVSLWVEDTGIGMRRDEVGQIFHRYWQGRPAALQGTGLGLAIAKAIVVAHGGSISVESAIGRGTTFEVCLPNRGTAACSATSIR